jgi:type I restriction enzyme R subunit
VVGSAILKYTNRNLTTAEIIAELVELAKKMRDDKNRSEELGLANDEIAFYDAVCQNDSAILQMGDVTLKQIAKELVKAVRSSISIDWNMKESVRAEMRAKVKRLLTRYDYPPDKEEHAIDLVLEQAELIAVQDAA